MLLPAALLPLFPACQSDPDWPAAALVIRDSAGVEIVENATPSDGSRLPWRIGPEPSVEIGVSDGEEPYMLYRAYDATLLTDGRIVIANTGTQELRVFDSAGVHLATWAGAGQGPGEFTGLSQVEPWSGDSIIAWYGPRGGLSVFDAGGTHGRDFVLAGQVRTPPMQRFFPVAAARDGVILAWHGPEAADTIAMQLRDRNGNAVATFGPHPAFDWHIDGEGERARLYQKTFGGAPVWALWGGGVVIGHTGRYELNAFAADGTPARIVRRDHRPRAPTAAELDAYIDAEVRRNRATGSEATALRRRFEAVPVAEHVPAFSSIMTDALDHLWVEEHDSPADPLPVRVWTVFDAQGRVLGFVETPKELRIDEVGADYILGVTTSELGVERVQVWPLERASG